MLQVCDTVHPVAATSRLSRVTRHVHAGLPAECDANGAAAVPVSMAPPWSATLQHGGAPLVVPSSGAMPSPPSLAPDLAPPRVWSCASQLSHGACDGEGPFVAAFCDNVYSTSRSHLDAGCARGSLDRRDAGCLTTSPQQAATHALLQLMSPASTHVAVSARLPAIPQTADAAVQTDAAPLRPRTDLCTELLVSCVHIETAARTSDGRDQTEA